MFDGQKLQLTRDPQSTAARPRSTDAVLIIPHLARLSVMFPDTLVSSSMFSMSRVHPEAPLSDHHTFREVQNQRDVLNLMYTVGYAFVKDWGDTENFWHHRFYT